MNDKPVDASLAIAQAVDPSTANRLSADEQKAIKRTYVKEKGLKHGAAALTYATIAAVAGLWTTKISPPEHGLRAPQSVPLADNAPKATGQLGPESQRLRDSMLESLKSNPMPQQKPAADGVPAASYLNQFRERNESPVAKAIGDGAMFAGFAFLLSLGLRRGRVKDPDPLVPYNLDKTSKAYNQSVIDDYKSKFTPLERLKASFNLGGAKANEIEEAKIAAYGQTLPPRLGGVAADKLDPRVTSRVAEGEVLKTDGTVADGKIVKQDTKPGTTIAEKVIGRKLQEPGM